MILGIDIGGTKVACALADRSGVLLGTERRPSPATGDARSDLERIADQCLDLLGSRGIAAGELEAVGLSVPGPIDRDAGLLMHPPNLSGWGEVPASKILGERLGCPVYLENDANAAALAEWRFGAGQGASDMVYLTMSTGVGGGLILGGRLYRGRIGSAGELGHVPVEWPGERCACGLRGCLEAYTGGRAWQAHLREVLPGASLALALAGGDRDALRPEHAVEAARQGDADAARELSRWIDYLARGIVQLVFSLAPEVIVLGTIAVAAGEELCLVPLRERVAEQSWPHQAPYMRIVTAELGDKLGEYAGIVVGVQALEQGAG